MRFLLAVLVVGCGNDHAPFAGNDPNVTSSGLSCEVRDALADCTGCHGSPLTNRAPIRLTRYDDLTRSYKGTTVIERCLARMKDAAAPMPPPPASAASTAAIATLTDWVASGMPPGDCGPDPFDQPPVCSSGVTWNGGDSESPLMHPGMTCIGCHRARGEGPRFSVAGTVYETAHEPNDCYGDPTTIVEVTDANGQLVRIRPNSAGNFYFGDAIAFPIQARVVQGDAVRVMNGAVSDGDCNGCHTQSGANQAPGRIVAP